MVTLSTPALRMKLPFLFHFRAKMGPLCWPSVLARFPVVKHQRGADLQHQHINSQKSESATAGGEAGKRSWRWQQLNHKVTLQKTTAVQRSSVLFHNPLENSSIS